MKRHRHIIIITLLCSAMLLLTGCKSSKRFVIHEASVSDMSMVVRDFAGLNGFRIVYANETPEKAAYRVFLGTTSYVIPAEQETVLKGYGRQLYTSEETEKEWVALNVHNHAQTIVTTERPAQHVETDWNFTLQLIQKPEGVLAIAKASGGYGSKKYLKAFLKQLKHEGLHVFAVK